MARKLPGQYARQTKEENRRTIKAQLIANMKSGKMKMVKNEVPLGGGVGKAVVKTSAKLARAIAKEAAGPKAKAPFSTYRKPSTSRPPKLRDVDGLPPKTTVRQQVGPKTKSGNFSEKKYPAKTNTQPPIRKPATEKPKVEIPDVTRIGGRVIAINKRSNNPRIRKRQEAQLKIGRREFLAERKRQEKLKIKRTVKDDTKTKTDFGIYSKSGKKYIINVPKSSKGSGSKEVRPEQTTIESRLQSRSESLPLSARNQAGTDRMPTAEWRRYAQILRDSTSKSPNVTSQQIARGRARATMPTAERRAAEIQAARNRFVAKAKAKGMTDAQIKQAIARARAEAASIARKAAK